MLPGNDGGGRGAARETVWREESCRASGPRIRGRGRPGRGESRAPGRHSPTRIDAARLLLRSQWPTSLRRSSLFLRRSEEHTSELQSLMRISYAVFCLKKKNNQSKNNHLRHYSNRQNKNIQEQNKITTSSYKIDRNNTHNKYNKNTHI